MVWPRVPTSLVVFVSAMIPLPRDTPGQWWDTLALAFAYHAVQTQETLKMQSQNRSSIRATLEPAALRDALTPRRPVFGNPWDSTADIFACYVAVSFIEPLLLWCGGKLMSAIFGFGSQWPLGVFIAAALVGSAGFMTIVGRERTHLSVDFLAVTAWLLLGLVGAPILGLALSSAAAIVSYAIVLLAILAYVLRFGRFETAFFRTVSWPVTWTLVAAFFAFSAYRLILFQ